MYDHCFLSGIFRSKSVVLYFIISRHVWANEYGSRWFKALGHRFAPVYVYEFSQLKESNISKMYTSIFLHTITDEFISLTPENLPQLIFAYCVKRICIVDIEETWSTIIFRLFSFLMICWDVCLNMGPCGKVCIVCDSGRYLAVWLSSTLNF